MKTHFTRKNFIALALTFFYCLIAAISGICLDANNPLKIKDSANQIKSLGIDLLGFKEVSAGFCGWILLSCFLVYVLLFTSMFIYEMRLAKYYYDKIFTKKYVFIYIATFLGSLILCFGIGMVAQYPYEIDAIVASLRFLLESSVVGLIIFILLLIIVGGICMLYINVKHIDEPFRWFGKKTKELEEEEKEKEEEKDKEQDEQGNLANSFGEVNSDANPTLGNGVGGNGSGSSIGGQVGETLKEKERVFPGLCSLDAINEANREEDFDDDNINLKDLVINFRNYLAKSEKLYFDINTIRAFISGLAASRLIILEGLSGTGKSSLARYFSDFISEESYFEAVQATWRDRTSILGYYNDFSKVYNETEFLKRLYDASFKKEHINIMVLDEVNISRVEYYFADFLSVLEYPSDKWKLKIMQLPYDFDAPSHLEDGILTIPENTFFIATANKDDSTYTITDKVYDRAISISFDDRNAPFEVEGDVAKIRLSFSKLQALFKEAIDNSEYNLTKDDLAKFKTITDFTYDTFDLTFGNRIMHQIELLVPVYVASGGSKIDALDFMFSKKVVSKLEGRFEDYIKDGLLSLKKLIEKTYGKDSFTLTNHTIDKLVRKL